MAAASFLESPLPTKAEWAASLMLPPTERVAAEKAATEKFEKLHLKQNCVVGSCDCMANGGDAAGCGVNCCGVGSCKAGGCKAGGCEADFGVIIPSSQREAWTLAQQGSAVLNFCAGSSVCRSELINH